MLVRHLIRLLTAAPPIVYRNIVHKVQQMMSQIRRISGSYINMVCMA